MRYLIAVLLALIATVACAEQMLDSRNIGNEASIGLLVRVSKDDTELGRQPPPARPLLPSGGEPASTPMR